MYKYFSKCRTAEEGKKLYHELAVKYHPDNGGTGKELTEIILEFKRWWREFKDVHTSRTGETYKSKKETTETAEEFIDIINNLSTLHNIEVELCGSWLWITGQTYPYKDVLKSFGCRWSVGKKKWYWTKAEYKNTKGEKHPSMDEIRNTFGSEYVKLNHKLELEDKE